MLHQIIFIIALSSEDFFASSTNISQRTSQSQFQTSLRLIKGSIQWSYAISYQRFAKLCCSLPTTKNDQKTVEQLQASWPLRVSLSKWSGEEADISNWGRHCDQFKKIQDKHKTLPKAQRTRGLSSYHKFKYKSWSNFILRISTKHQLQNLNQTSASP